MPTFILPAVHDRVGRFDLAKEVHAGIEGSQLVPCEWAGHACCCEDREKVNAELVRFLGAAEAAPRGMAAWMV